MEVERSPRVVLADDQPHIRMMMRVVLARAGFQVLAEAGDGQDAVERCRESRPDLVLLDVNMPGMHGDAALRAILAEQPRIVAIMLTAESDSALVGRCIELGAADYVRKDVPVEEISQRILRTWMAKRPHAGPR